VWDLNQAVGIMATDQLGKSLNDEQVAKIVAFLKSLTGEQPRVTYPILPPSVASTPRPQP
jgi:cytochrome c peroxidase